jgi:hypothetical protein
VAGYSDRSNKFSVSITADNFFSRRTNPRSRSIGRLVGWLVSQLQSQSVTYSASPSINQLSNWFVS